MFVLWSARAAAARSRDPVPSPLRGRRDVSTVGAQSFSCEVFGLGWWWQGPKNSDPAEGPRGQHELPLHPPGDCPPRMAQSPLPGSPDPCCLSSLQTAALGGSAGTRESRELWGRGRGFLGWAKRGAGLAGLEPGWVTGLVNPPLSRFNTKPFISTGFPWCSQQPPLQGVTSCPLCNILLGKTLMGQQECSCVGQGSFPPSPPHKAQKTPIL